MSKILMRMRDVPEDEADEVRSLLEHHGIEIYETFAGNWGISMPAIWVKDDTQFEQANSLLNDYQQTRTKKVRQEYEQAKQRGEFKTLGGQFLDRPFHSISYSVLLIVVLFISIYYFFNL